MERGTNDSSQKLMQMLLDALLNTMNKQPADQLPGGKFWEPLEALIDQINSYEATNISGERQFAKMKVIQQKAPRMTMTKIENRKMFDSAVVWNESTPYVSFINTRIFFSICSWYSVCTRFFSSTSYHSTLITY